MGAHAHDSRTVVGRECRFVIAIPNVTNDHDQVHAIKEIIHYSDGTTEPNLWLEENYKRPVYVVRPEFRKYKESKIAEEIRKLQKITTTDRLMPQRLARELRTREMGLKQLCSNPYIYGADITAAAFIKRRYQQQWPNIQTKSTVAVVDIERDVVRGTNEIISISLTYQEHIFIVYTKAFIKGTTITPQTIHQTFDKYLKRHMDDRKLVAKVTAIQVNTPGEGVMRVYKEAHRLMPDFLAIWNINFDLPLMIQALEVDGYDVASVLSDPRVPDQYRYAKYIEGKKNMVREDGTRTTLKFEQQWHTLIAPATFYHIDAACVYKRIRSADGNERYSLDAILNKELKLGKLKFDEAKDYERAKLLWHKYMQEHHRAEYIIYNVFDCMGMELLDEQTGDLALTLDVLNGFSEYAIFNSTPKQLVDDLYFYARDNKGMIMGSSSSNNQIDLDKKVVSRNGWPVALATHLVVDGGLKCIEELPDHVTNIYADVGDEDVKTAYPENGILWNVDKATTKLEMCKIAGVGELDKRMVGINLTCGYVNAVEYCNIIHNFPKLDTLLADFKADMVD